MSQPIKFYYKKASITKSLEQKFSETAYTVKTEYLSKAIREAIIQLKAADPNSITGEIRMCFIPDEDYAKIRKEILLDSRILPRSANDYVTIYESVDLRFITCMLRPLSCKEHDTGVFEDHKAKLKEEYDRRKAIAESELGTLTYETFKPTLRKLVNKGEGFDKGVLSKMYKDFKQQTEHLTVKDWAVIYMKDWTLEKEKLSLIL